MSGKTGTYNLRHRISGAFQTVDKPLCFLKMGSQGRSPRQGLGAVAPHSAPARMPGVYAQSSARCRAYKAYTAFHRGKGGRGIGIINQKLISKTDFFYKLRAGSVTCPQIFCSFLYPMKLCGTTHQSIINKRQKN